MKAIIYARVSSREQEETGYSLPAQKKLLEDYAQKKGIQVAKAFAIAESANGKKQRAIFSEMIAYVDEHKITTIICEKTDRLTRTRKDAVLIDEWVKTDPEKQVHFVKENFILSRDSRANEKFMWGIKVEVAQYYINNLSEEVRKGNQEKLAQGHIPRRAIFGYKTIGEKGHKIHVVDESSAPFIRKMYEMYATGNYSLKRLGEEMYQNGLRTPAGKKPAKSWIEKVLKNPYYYGAIPWNGEIRLNGAHEPLVSQDLFKKVQTVRSRGIAPKYQRHQFRFRKLLECGECGGTITGEIQKGHVYYHCNHYRTCSQKTYTREEAVEDQLMGVFKFFENITPVEAELIKEKIKKDHSKETSYKENIITSLKDRYLRLQRRLDVLYDDRLDERISPETWERKNKEISEEQNEIRNQLEKLKDEETEYFEIGLNILDLARRAKEIYENRSPEERRLLLSYIFSNIVLKDNRVAYTLNTSVNKIAERVQQKLDQQNNFEPNKKLGKQGRKKVSGLKTNTLLPDRDSNPN